jgi:hypothetical protein
MWRDDGNADKGQYKNCAHTRAAQLNTNFWFGWILEASDPSEISKIKDRPGGASEPTTMDEDMLEPLHEKIPQRRNGDTYHNESIHTFGKRSSMFGRTAGLSKLFETSCNLSWHAPPPKWSFRNGIETTPINMPHMSETHLSLLKEIGEEYTMVSRDPQFSRDHTADVLMRNWLGYFLAAMENHEDADSRDMEATTLLYYTVKIAGEKVPAMLDAGSGLEAVIGLETATRLGLQNQFEKHGNPIRVRTAYPAAPPWICTNFIPMKVQMGRFTFTAKFNVLPVSFGIILGLPWLVKYNPAIDWATWDLDIAKNMPSGTRKYRIKTHSPMGNMRPSPAVYYGPPINPIGGPCSSRRQSGCHF